MAINNVKNAREARLVGTELRVAASELALGILMTGDDDPMRLLQALDQVGQDYLNWSEGKADDEEVFIPTEILAQLDQTQAEVDTFMNNFDRN
jgi:hypothetical protein